MEFIIYISISVVSLTLLVFLILEKLKVRRLAKETLQLIFDNDELLAKLARAYDQIDNKPIEESEGFVRFLSQSREQAFKYIEETQGIISNFVNQLQLILDLQDDSKLVNDIEAELIKLKEMLPKE